VAPPLLHWSQTVTVPAATATLSAGRTPPPSASRGCRPDPPPFTRVGSRRPPPSSLATTPCLSASPVSCLHATSSLRDVDTKAPQPQPSRPRPVRHLLPSMPEAIVPIELQVNGTAQRRTSAQSRSTQVVLRSTSDGPLRLPIRANSTSTTTSTRGSSSSAYVPHPSFCLPPSSVVSGKPPPLLWFKSLHHLTDHLLDPQPTSPRRRWATWPAAVAPTISGGARASSEEGSD
jgi:hypothetical protein